MFNILGSLTRKFNDIISSSGMTDKQFFEEEIAKWKRSPQRTNMLTGEKYYVGEQDILDRKRTIIGKDGKLQEVDNLPNNKIIDNQYAEMVDQKVNYLLGKPLTFDCENKAYVDALIKVFNKKVHRTIKNLGIDSLNGGIGWLYPYYDEKGKFCFRKFEPYEILPFWEDAEHTTLDCAVRLYEITAYEGVQERTVEKVELYTPDGIERYTLNQGTLVEDTENPGGPYLTIEDDKGEETAHNWERIPLIPFKYNSKEIPLIMRVKSLQDGINTILSDFENNMQEDSRNTVLVLKNYDGTNLGEFRHNLATFGVVKVQTIDGADGGVDTLKIEVNADNYKCILDLFKKALVKNARGYDADDERMNGNPNQMNIQSMYSRIDLDANGMETEFQASFEELLWFINKHFANTGVGDFDSEEVNIIFNRDILINESEVIENCGKSVGILSNETVVSQHPWTTDVEKELQRLEEEQQAAMEREYEQAFNEVNKVDETNEGVNKNAE